MFYVYVARLLFFLGRQCVCLSLYNRDIKRNYSVSATEAVSGCTYVAICSNVFIPNNSYLHTYLLNYLHTYILNYLLYLLTYLLTYLLYLLTYLL
jgi:hypothetical protein